MKDMEVKKRGWVKTAVIVFLAVMLVLTFFSNTIMNRSLPEVATQYASSGTITARIRGNGTVAANDIFPVVAEWTREVLEVPVRVGDVVNIGDVLVVFDGDVSGELRELQDRLLAKERELEEWVINNSGSNSNLTGLVQAVQSARNALNDARRVLAGIPGSEAEYNAAVAANNQAQADLNAATAAQNARQFESDIADAELAVLNDQINAGEYVDPDVLATAEQKVIDAASALRFANATVSNAQSTASLRANELGNMSSWLSASNTVRDLQLNLNAANTALSQAQQAENITSSLDQLVFDDLNREIEELRDQIAEKEKDDGSSELKAFVGGRITEISIRRGEMTAPGDILMTIENTDRGYSLSFEVTADQARRVSVGDQAEVDNRWWWGAEDIRATLVAIRNNPQNPATGRILVFSVTGAEDGEQLSLVLNQRSENYNIIVPNIAVRSDSNGDFVLLLESRSSPLGNRFVAQRVDVNILARDDTHTAVSGGISSWGDFVITHSSRPINPGDQVRLTDNP
jgi:multidrug efflux pump subunit AcrA (membrane-fusion protein)